MLATRLEFSAETISLMMNSKKEGSKPREARFTELKLLRKLLLDLVKKTCMFRDLLEYFLAD